MKVICIDDHEFPKNNCCPSVGDTVTVESTGFDWEPLYVLEGYNGVWSQRYFAPVSDIDERDSQREYDKQEVIIDNCLAAWGIQCGSKPGVLVSVNNV